MARSITSRNFWGGFWGGVLGILATAKFGSLALMGGCLVGVMLGFYYQELWQAAKTSWTDALVKITGPRTGPTFGDRWAVLHPYDKAHRIKKASMWVAGFTLSMIAIGILSTIDVVHNNDRFFGWLMTGGFCFISILFGCLLRFGAAPDEKGWTEMRLQMRYYYKLQEIYINKGAFYLFAREYCLSFVSCLAVPAGLAVAFGGVGGIVLAMIVVPPLAVLVFGSIFIGLFVFGFMRGTYRLATKPDHWSCLLLTIITTGLVALFGSSYLEGAALMVTALVAGTLSGAGAVTVHPVLHQWFDRHPGLARLFRRRMVEHRNMFLEAVRAMVSPKRYQLKVRDVLSEAVR